jgi:hypothetical protein
MKKDGRYLGSCQSLPALPMLMSMHTHTHARLESRPRRAAYIRTRDSPAPEYRNQIFRVSSA